MEDGVAGLRIAGCIVQTEFLEEFIHGHGDRDLWYRDRYCGPLEVVIPHRGHGPRPEVCVCVCVLLLLLLLNSLNVP